MKFLLRPEAFLFVHLLAENGVPVNILRQIETLSHFLAEPDSVGLLSRMMCAKLLVMVSKLFANLWVCGLNHTFLCASQCDSRGSGASRMPWCTPEPSLFWRGSWAINDDGM
jgi:hypothetical protein